MIGLKIMLKKKIFSFTIRILSLFLIIFLLYLYLKNKFSFVGFINSIKTLSWIELAIILTITNAVVILRAFNWKLILNPEQSKKYISFKNYLAPIYASQALNIVIPGKGGELIRFFYVKDYFSTGKCIGSILFERVVDLLSLLLFSLTGIFLIKNIYTTIFSITAFISLLAILIIFFNQKIFLRFKKLIFKFIKSEKIRKAFEDFGLFYSEIGKNKKKILLFSVLSILGWIIAIIQCYLMLTFLNVDISFYAVISRVPIGILITLIPVSFGGLGTREAAFLFLFNNLIIPEKIIAFSLLFYFSRILFHGLIGIIPLVNLKFKTGKNIKKIS